MSEVEVFENEPILVHRPDRRIVFDVAVLMKDESDRSTWIQKLSLPDRAEPSNQSTTGGEKPWPIDRRAVVAFKDVDTHHSSCIETKRDATTGLGHKSDETHEKLDELCASSWQDVLNLVAEDYWQVGDGYLEVVRDGESITGLHHLPATNVHVYVDDPKTYEFHYIVRAGLDAGGQERHFACFGERDLLAARRQVADPSTISEVIRFSRPTSRSRWYGLPDWTACVPAVELVMSILQYNYDFFHNRGVPEFIFIVTGKKIDDQTWKKIKQLFEAHVGLGNTHKSLALNFQEEGIKVEVIKLAMEKQDLQGSFDKMLDGLSLRIVSGHRVPPLLAGIQIPGKLGASNELPNAMAAFQALVIGSAQRAFRDKLYMTIGKVLGLEREAFEFNAITDYINMAAMQDAAQTRDPLGPADPDESISEKGGLVDANGRRFRSGDRQTVATLALEDLDVDKMTPEQKGRLIGGAVAGALGLNGS